MRIGITGALAAAGFGLGAVCAVAQGPLPGDVAITHALQAALGTSPRWAKLVTDTAKPPLLWGTICVAAALAWLRGGARTVVGPPLALAGVWLLDQVLRAVIQAPRPSGDLVVVASASPGSGLPSTFALVYGALLGAVLLGRGTGGIAPLPAIVVSIAAIAVGSCARVTLAGHWPSQVIASLAVALAVAAICVRQRRAADLGGLERPAVPPLVRQHWQVTGGRPADGG